MNVLFKHQEQDIAAMIAAGDEDGVYQLVNDLNLPEDVAADFYARCADAVHTVVDVRRLYNLAWITR